MWRNFIERPKQKKVFVCLFILSRNENSKDQDQSSDSKALKFLNNTI